MITHYTYSILINKITEFIVSNDNGGVYANPWRGILLQHHRQFWLQKTTFCTDSCLCWFDVFLYSEKRLSVPKNRQSPDVSHSLVANPLCDAHLQDDQVAGLDIAVSSPSNHAHSSQMNTVYQASNPDNRGLISLPPVNGVNSVELFERGSPAVDSII